MTKIARPKRPAGPEPPSRAERPILMRPEKLEKWDRYRADLDAYYASLFNFAQLKQIVSEVKAPAVQDTPAAHEVVKLVVCGISIDELTKSWKSPAIKKKFAAKRRAWAAVRKIVSDRVRGEEEQRAWLQEHPYPDSSNEGKEEKWFEMSRLIPEEELRQMQDFLMAMDKIGALFRAGQQRPSGKRGSALIRNPTLGALMFNSLQEAWKEAVVRVASREKSYKIVRELLVLTGDKGATVAAVKQMILRRPKT